jgi:hypothetical protein
VSEWVSEWVSEYRYAQKVQRKEASKQVVRSIWHAPQMKKLVLRLQDSYVVKSLVYSL